MKYAPVWTLLFGFLGGCSSLPLSQANGGIKTLYVYPQPSCVIICTASISAIREDVDSGHGNVSTGAKTNTQTATPPKP